MSMGIMGCSASFVNAAKAHVKKGGNYLVYRSGSGTDVARISCSGTIKVESTYGGEAVIQEYTDLNNTFLSVQADTNTDIKITGDVTLFRSFYQGSGMYQLNYLDVSHCFSLVELHIENAYLSNLDLSKNVGLKILEIAGGGNTFDSLDLSHNIALTDLKLNLGAITTIDLSHNTQLVNLDCNGWTKLETIDLPHNGVLQTAIFNQCSSLTELDFSNSHTLESLSINGCIAIQTLNLSNTILSTLNCTVSDTTALSALYYAATNETVTTRLVSYLQNTGVTDGILYTDSDAAYYQTLADEATAKGWTIEQIQA